MLSLAQLRAHPLAALQQSGLDLSTAVGAARLVAGRRIRMVAPGALLRFARDVARNGRRGARDLFHLHALNTPDALALVFGERRYSWRELDERCNRLAHGLRSLGVGPRDRVAILAHNCPEHIETGAAATDLGAVHVPVGYRLKAKEIAYLLRDSGARALVFGAEFAHTVEEALAEGGGPRREACVMIGVLPGGASSGFTSYEALLAAGRPDVPPRVEGERHAGIMVYTSGTTGRPKGATRDLQDMSFGPTLNFLADLPASCDERHLMCCPLYHSAGTFFTTITMALGATLFLHERFEPEAVLDAIERERITSVVLVPTMWNRLVALGPRAIRSRDLSSLRWIMSAAAPLPTELARRIEDAFGPLLYNFYAATETGVVTLARPGEHTARPGTIGRVVRGTTVRLLDTEGREVGTGEVGEMYVRNGMLVDGYFGNAEATRAAQREGFFSVGDLAWRDADGYYYLADRKTDMVISGGVNIYPLEIEQRLHCHPAVLDAAVVGYPDPEWGESLAAFVVLREGQHVASEELQKWITEDLADYKKPRKVYFVDQLPRNPTGKVLKRELKQRLVEEAGAPA